MGMYSKLIGSIVGGIMGLLGSKYAMPADMQSPEMVAALTTVLSAIATFFFPANKGN